jgi:hypothetical protein
MCSLRRPIALLVAGLLAGGVTHARAEEPPPNTTTEGTPAPTPTPTPAPASTSDAAPTRVAQPAGDDLPRPSRKLAIGLAGGAAAAFVTGIVLCAVAKSRSDEQNGSTSAPPLYTPSLRDRGKQGEAMADSGYLFLALGSALAIADIVLWVERSRSHKATTHVALEGGGGARIVPAPTGLAVAF